MMSEREAIVAWLNAEAAEMANSAEHYGARGIWHLAADYDRQAGFFLHQARAIERGDHLKGTDHE